MAATRETNSDAGRAKRLAPEERRAQLRAVALDLLAEHGLGHTNHAMVAQKAGVSLPTIMHYYPQHTGLVDAALAEVAEFLLDGIAGRVAAASTDAREAVVWMLIALARAMDTQQSHIRVWLDWSTATRHPAWTRYLAFRSAACAVVEDVLRKGQAQGNIQRSLDPAEAAEVIVGLAHMIAQMRFTGSDLDQVKQRVERLLDGYLG